jgi:hypothetical protein
MRVAHSGEVTIGHRGSGESDADLTQAHTIPLRWQASAATTYSRRPGETTCQWGSGVSPEAEPESRPPSRTYRLAIAIRRRFSLTGASGDRVRDLRRMKPFSRYATCTRSTHPPRLYGAGTDIWRETTALPVYNAEVPDTLSNATALVHRPEPLGLVARHPDSRVSIIARWRVSSQGAR